MATSPATIAHLTDILAGAGDVSARKMFGEYALYLNGKVVALVCDDQLFVKPTPGALALIGAPETAPPYPGAKPHVLITDALDDHDLMARLLQVVAAETSAPKPRKPKVK